MADLVVQGPKPENRWRRNLPTGESVVIGRTAQPWAIAWDELISRRHAELVWDGDKLHVRRFAESRNPIFVHGQQDNEFGDPMRRAIRHR